MKYEVFLSRSEGAELVVDAESREEAIAKAFELAMSALLLKEFIRSIDSAQKY